MGHASSNLRRLKERLGSQIVFEAHRMPFSRTSFAAAVFIPIMMSPPARALGACDVGDLCTIQSALFGCKDASLIKRWIDLNIEISREAAETFIADKVTTGECAQFKEGDKLRITRYIGMRRIEVQRPGETERFIMLLK
jgi:hypothetical protein